MSKTIRGLTSYSGGGAGSLDLIDGGALANGDRAEVRTSLGVFDYVLDASSGASESLPYVVSPDTNPGTKRWLLVIPNGPFSHANYYLGSDQTMPTGGAFNAIEFDTKVYDTLDEFNTTTFLFTATYTGFYHAVLTYAFTNEAWASAATNTFGIIEGPSYSVYSPRAYVKVTSNYRLGATIGHTFSLTASQTLEFKSYNASASTKDIDGSQTATFVTVDRMP